MNTELLQLLRDMVKLHAEEGVVLQDHMNCLAVLVEEHDAGLPGEVPDLPYPDAPWPFLDRSRA
jgi:hypothetical protein